MTLFIKIFLILHSSMNSTNLFLWFWHTGYLFFCYSILSDQTSVGKTSVSYRCHPNTCHYNQWELYGFHTSIHSYRTEVFYIQSYSHISPLECPVFHTAQWITFVQWKPWESLSKTMIGGKKLNTYRYSIF